MFRYACTFAVVLLLLHTSGCGSKGPLRVPVTGTVTLDGSELNAAVLEFIPTGRVAGSGGTGRTGRDGRYEITTWQGKEGLPPGEYRVMIEKRVMPDGSDFPFDGDQWPDAQGLRQVLPKKYASRKDTVLKTTVTEEEAQYDFALNSQ